MPTRNSNLAPYSLRPRSILTPTFNFVWSQESELSVRSTTISLGTEIIPGIRLFGAMDLEGALKLKPNSWSIGAYSGLIPFTWKLRRGYYVEDTSSGSSHRHYVEDTSSRTLGSIGLTLVYTSQSKFGLGAKVLLSPNGLSLIASTLIDSQHPVFDKDQCRIGLEF